MSSAKQKAAQASLPTVISAPVAAIKPQIVLTRPIGSSDTVASALLGQGFDVMECPLFRLSSVEDTQPLQQVWADVERYALVIFVSPNAIDYAWAGQPPAHAMHHASSIAKRPWPLAVPIGVMGPGSIAALARHGVCSPPYQVIAPAGAVNALSASDSIVHYDSEAFAAALAVDLGWEALRARPVLVVRGNQGRVWLSEYLQANGVQVESVCAYCSEPLAPSPAQWSTILHALDPEKGSRPQVWVLTSSGSVRHLDTLIRTQMTAHQYACFQQQPIIATHARVAVCAKTLGFSKVIQADLDSASIIRALWACYRTSNDAR